MPNRKSEHPSGQNTVPARSSTRADRISQAYEWLREYIVSGRLAPGTRIVENEIVERFGVSRTPVRSALQKLEQEGYVVAVEGGKNTRLVVSPLTQKDAHELYNIVAELEALAARWAAGLAPAARTELVERLEQLNAELFRLAAAEALEGGAVFDVHTEFHASIVNAVDAPRLHVLHSSIKPQAERYRRVYSSASPENTRASAEEHVVIIDAIARGDAAAAERAVVANWQNSAERLSKVIRRAGEWGNW